MSENRNGSELSAHPLRRLARYWEVVFWLGLSFVLLLTIINSVVLVELGDTRFVITVAGSVVVLRKVLQLIFAYRHNQKQKRLIWEPLIEALIERYPNDEKWLQNLLRKHITHDDRRTLVQERYPEDLGTPQQWKAFRQLTMRDRPKIAGVSPAYKTGFQRMRELLYSVSNQTLPPDLFIIVVNGQWDERVTFVSQLRALVRELNANPNVETRFVVRLRDEGDKRNAMKQGFEEALASGAAYVFNTDSDTFLDIDAIMNAALAFIADPKVFGLTGDVRIINPRVNFLTLMTAIRYFFAFNIERAAQSLFHQMTCFSGPFLMLRREALELIIEPWSNQHFLGKRATFGDDRHLATLLLILRLGTIFASECICWTESPTTMAEWLLQQLRWNKSADRENWILIVVNRLKGLHWYIKFDLFYLTLFPILIAAAIGMVLIRAFGVFLAVLAPAVEASLEASRGLTTTNTLERIGQTAILVLYPATLILPAFGAAGYVLLPYITVIIVINVSTQGVYGWRLTGDWRYLFSFAYARYLPQLIWLKIKAKREATQTVWGTK